MVNILQKVNRKSVKRFIGKFKNLNEIYEEFENFLVVYPVILNVIVMVSNYILILISIYLFIR